MAQKQFIGPDGTIYEEAPGGGYVVVPQAGSAGPMTVGTPDPNAALERTAKQLNIERMAREAARSPVQAQADAVQLERNRLALEKERSGGTGPAPARIPATALNGIQENLRSLRQIDAALKTIDPRTGRPESIGPGTGFFGDTVTQFNDPDGTATRSKVGEIGAVKIHALSGAAVSASEAPRFLPFVPKVTDRPEVARQKLLSFREGLVSQIQEQEVAYSPANGYLPYKSSLGSLSDYLQNSGTPKKDDDQSDKTAMFYANGADNGGGNGGQAILAPGGSRAEADPVLKGVNAKVNSMLKSGKSDDEIVGYLKQVGANAAPSSVAAALDFRRKNPGYKGNYGVDLETRSIPMSGARQAFQSVGAGPVGSYAVGAADALTAGRLDNIAGAISGDSEQVQAAKALLAKANPGASLLGNVTGGALATAGLEFGLARSGLQAASGLAGTLARSPVAADALYGSAMGSDEGGALGAAGGALAGVAGGYLGQRVAGAIGGVRDGVARGLRDRGVPLTLGQAVGQSGRMGAAIKGIEDRLSGIPIVGSFANARRLEGMQGYNRAAFDEALAPVAGNTKGVIGPAGVDAAQNVVGNAYDDALDGVTVRADAPFARDIVGAVRNARRLPGEMAGNADYTLRERVGASFTPGRELTGRNYQQSLRGLRRDTAAVEDLPYGYDFGQVTGQAEDALDGLLTRQAPGVVEAKRAADRAFRLTEVVRNAVNRSRNGGRTGETGVFAPSQLTDAAAQNAQRFGNSAGTTNQPFYELNTAAQTVLPNAVPDSGTAGRLALSAGLLGGGAGAGYLGDDTKKGVAVGAALAALQSQAAQRALVAAVLDRPDVLRRASDFAVRNRIGGSIGAPLALQAIPSR